MNFLNLLKHNKMIIRTNNFIQDAEVQQELEKYGIEFQYLKPKNTVATFYVTGSFNFKELQRLTPEQFVLEYDDRIHDFDAKWQKIIETEAMRDAIDVKTDNSEVIANLQNVVESQSKKIDSQFEYIDTLEKMNESQSKRLNEIESITFNYALENRIEEIEKIFGPTKQVHEIARKYEITPELIEELKQFVK